MDERPVANRDQGERVTATDGESREERLERYKHQAQEIDRKIEDFLARIFAKSEQEVDERLEEIKRRTKALKEETRQVMARVVSDREGVIEAKGQFLERVEKLAYYASEQAATQATGPLDVWIEAENRLVPAFERYSEILNKLASINTGLNPRYDELSSKVQDLYSPKDHLEKIREVAYYAWWSAGRNTANLIDFWFRYERDSKSAAESLVRSLATWTQAQRPELFISDERERVPYDQFSPARFVERLTELAYCMWDYNGRKLGTTLLDFWAQAEAHLSAVMVSAFHNAGSTVEAGRNLAEALANFSPEAHMRRIQDVAYGLWLQAGQPVGRELDYWVAAEQQVLSELNPRPSDDQ